MRTTAPTAYTTRAQADELARRLDLRPGVRLLELGSGRGWPGSIWPRAAAATCSSPTCPSPAWIAAARATAEGLTGRCGVAAADGAHLPFRAGAFDAVVHADVLC